MSVFTVDEAKELIEADGAVELDALVGKHDCHWQGYVVPFNGKMYQFEVEVSFENGWEDDFSTEPFEVTKETKVITKTFWKPVEKPSEAIKTEKQGKVYPGAIGGSQEVK